MPRRLTVKEMLRNEEARGKAMGSALVAENKELGTELSEREIQEIVQGQQMSELEIMILGGV